MNLRELADSLGLSQTTVSRALNGYPEVREATRNRVLAAARAAGYAPNARARRLATGRTMTVGHVIPLSGKAEMVNPIFADFLAGAGEVYAREGYDMVLSVVPDDDAPGAYAKMAKTGSVDGIMVQAPRRDDPRIDLLRRLGLPFLVHGRTGDAPDHSFLDIRNEAAFREATRLLLDLGHRRIALINGQESYDFARRRRAGYVAALRAAGIAPDPALLHSDTMTESYGHAAAAALLDAPDPPTGFVVSSVIPAIGVRRAAGERGLRLGREVSLVCHDDVLSYLGNSEDGPAFTATRSPIRAAGARCAEILIALIRDPGRAPIQEVWDTDLILGRSTGPCIAARASRSA